MSSPRVWFQNPTMLKWAGIITVVALIIGALVVAGVIQLAAGLVKIGLFVVFGLIAALVIGGIWVKKKID